MIVDDELREHLAESLYHLEFLRDFMRRTGFVEEINELGWPYGRDPNGGWGDEIYDGQLNTMLRLLAPSLTGEATFTSNDAQIWNTCRLIDGVHEQDDVFFDLAFAILIKGEDAHEVEGWRRFIWWQECRAARGQLGPTRPNTFLFVNEEEEQPHFIWVLPEPSTDEILEAWHKILVTWEVMNFYGHVADASAWRRLRGTPGINDGTGKVPAA
ncbi:MAG: hypothetical protein K6T83_09685 [Alicyclobacillus sp.]|nr:hypothetical protein [Alicyclobacillus sp.]